MRAQGKTSLPSMKIKDRREDLVAKEAGHNMSCQARRNSSNLNFALLSHLEIF
ncbi:hypothetical protein HMPREF1557_00665 [Streptococcus sobrinus W1703]|uniref:Uncharacterized protein n=1 Tax=Streptococcus sobrinus W1703 TaxID=1227275 RepID=U2KS31_9STRE|nr:hypothetical protein HMPREF1557_00665 [Streptococcus sobrinus W1703]